ncbi:MAG: hypothetical protein AAGC57_06255 [Pseudomonadota bacterium]
MFCDRIGPERVEEKVYFRISGEAITRCAAGSDETGDGDPDGGAARTPDFGQGFAQAG